MDDAPIRRGRPADAPDYAELALLTGPELLPALFGSESNFKKVMRGSFPRPKNPFSFEHSHFIEMNGRTAGMALALTHDQLSKDPLRTMLLLMRYLKLSFVTQIVHMYRSSEIMAQTEGGDYYLANIATYPEFRSRGLGTRLMDAVETEARVAGSRRIVLDVETDNKRAIELYERLSFRVESKSPVLRIKHHYFEFYRMTKELTRAGTIGTA
jgi:ribosomal protein S18 acetylase RimI-like enzyme